MRFIAIIATITLLIGCKGQISSELAEKNITAIQAVEMMAQNSNIKVLDVRTPEEIAEGKIEGAIEIDYKAKGFEENIKALDKNDSYLVYCRSGGRSGRALELMNSLDFKKVYNVKDGYSEFSKAKK